MSRSSARDLQRIIESMRELLDEYVYGETTAEEDRLIDDLCLWFDGYRKGRSAEAAAVQQTQSTWTDGPAELVWESKVCCSYPINDIARSLDIRYRVCQSAASGRFFFECVGDSVQCESIEQGKTICNDHNVRRISEAFGKSNGREKHPALNNARISDTGDT